MPLLTATAFATVLIGTALPPALEPWEPVFALGDRGAAVMTIADLLRLANAVNSRRDLDPPTRALVDRVADNLDSLDLDTLYTLVPNHRFEVYGRLAPSGAFAVQASRIRRFGRFGDVRLNVQMQQRDPQRFTVRGQLDSHVRLDKRVILEMASRSLTFLHTSASRVASTVPRGRDRSDDRMLLQLRRAFPESMAFVERYAEIRDFVAPGPRIRVHLRVNRKALHADYPELAATAELAKRVYRARARFVDDRGRTIAVTRFDTDTLDIVIAFVPDVRVLSIDRFRTDVDIESNVGGVDIAVRGLKIASDIRADTNSTTIVSRMRRMPVVRISGGALIDAIIPSDLETIINGVLSALTGSDNGRGARWSVEFPVRRDDPVRASTNMDLASNGFITFALRVLRRLEVGTDTIAGLERLTTRGLAAFEADFVRFQDALDRTGIK